ncbi:hypothetical protein [Geminicoccus harenae]|uniref:hypothetical protein n=1 Tax=Geminicoccus harenae TaxID=2498453 RepID=UPI00168B433C|nr:hypothetical protein [Geminicoccus harenae]
MKGKDLTDGPDQGPPASKDAAKYIAPQLKNKATSRGRARELLRQAAIELRLRSVRATKLPFPRLVAVIEEQKLSIDRFRRVDENCPIREWRV